MYTTRLFFGPLVGAAGFGPVPGWGRGSQAADRVEAWLATPIEQGLAELETAELCEAIVQLRNVGRKRLDVIRAHAEVVRGELRLPR